MYYNNNNNNNNNSNNNNSNNNSSSRLPEKGTIDTKMNKINIPFHSLLIVSL